MRVRLGGSRHTHARPAPALRLPAAYDLLGDPDKRARFDRGEIDASGMERPRQRYYRDFAEGAHPYASEAGFADFAEVGANDARLIGQATG